MRVEPSDLYPDGWTCEGCGYAFQSGDVVMGLPIAMTSNGEVVEGDYRCAVCWLTETEVKHDSGTQA